MERIALWYRGTAAFPERVLLHVKWGVHVGRDHEAGQHGMVTPDLAPPWAFVWGASNG